MRRRRVLRRLVASGLALAAILVFGAIPSWQAADAVCPKCGAPREPGATFCGRCGYKFAEAAAPEAAGADGRGGVVQVVTAHDNELTSTYASLAYESNLRVDSILGSAFAVAPGEFVTDSGLLVGATEVALRAPSGRSFPARVVGSDAMIGVALLKCDVPGITVLSLRGAEPPRAGESVTALGYSSHSQASGDPVASAGVVSGLHRGGARIHPIEDYLQTDASLPHGLAGGPWIDARGNVVGMSTGRVLGSRVFLGPESGIGYAVPAEWIARAADWIRSGAAPRSWMGAYATTVDPESRAEFKLPPQVTLLIDQVYPESPAASAGLKRGDGLLKIEGDEASSLLRSQQRLLAKRSGDRVEVQVIRGGEPLSLSVTLATRPDKPRLSAIDALRFFADLQLVSQKDEKLVVGSVGPGSELAHLKIAPGDALLSVLSKKDWLHGAKDNSHWRSVHTVADLEARLDTAYSDVDFCLGLRFRSKDGTKREAFLWEILTSTAAL